MHIYIILSHHAARARLRTYICMYIFRSDLVLPTAKTIDGEAINNEESSPQVFPICFMPCIAEIAQVTGNNL